MMLLTNFKPVLINFLLIEEYNPMTGKWAFCYMSTYYVSDLILSFYVCYLI